MYASIPGLSLPIKPASEWRLRAMARHLAATERGPASDPEELMERHRVAMSVWCRLSVEDQIRLREISQIDQ